MAEVSIEVGGRSYQVNCRDGGEAHLMEIAQLLDTKARDAQRAVGGINETRHLLLAALLLADEVHEARRNGGTLATPDPVPAASPAPPPNPQPDFAPILEKLAERVESLAQRLEGEATNA
ncbi:cell division protein ZapA [Sphingomonas sp. LaA6.9]|uniref:cell division protein ZapA n=1 Tax=Sphingomonas sp. LaA6.9 TaxID=2919914 RepID=UPI001F4FE772|nr:cell division protein ZapA [Sphingomonas sp. LaA6.9]MCJ8156017.1 cell division protein ZapA [Sphingomonas sp. LaA6.9]